MRTIIAVNDHDVELLDNICVNEHLTRTAAIRLAIKDFIEKKMQNKSRAFGAFADVFGDADSVDIQRKLRNEFGK